jgi:hypothetical protein
MQISLSYRRLDDGFYTTGYALSGDENWRGIKDGNGKWLRFETAYQAEAAAGHRLVAELRKLEASQ